VPFKLFLGKEWEREIKGINLISFGRLFLEMSDFEYDNKEFILIKFIKFLLFLEN
jgi:hypothetical protein